MGLFVVSMSYRVVYSSTVKVTLQRKTDLAFRTLNVLVESGTRWRARELAGAVDSTPEFILQVLAPLVRAGWVESRRGPTGGYRLQSTAALIVEA